MLNVSEAELLRQQETLAHDMTNARRKQSLVRALRDEFGLWPEAEGLRDGIAGLFQAIYPGAPIPRGDVELIVTGTLVFFCLPLTKDAESLTSVRFESLSADKKTEVRQFLRKLKRFGQERFANFPAFGLVECDRISRPLIERLAQRSSLSESEVLEELPRVMTILPRDEIDKYLIHDVWGHGWQASMLRFDNLYQQIAEFADPLNLQETASMSSGRQFRLAECFSGTGEKFRLDEERFREFATAEVCQRLPAAPLGGTGGGVSRCGRIQVLGRAPPTCDMVA